MFRPIPEVPYEKFKSSLQKHTWTHYLFHCTYCFVKDNINKKYNFYTPKKWIKHHDELLKISEDY
jgi:hypothetical protein